MLPWKTACHGEAEDVYDLNLFFPVPSCHPHSENTLVIIYKSYKKFEIEGSPTLLTTLNKKRAWRSGSLCMLEVSNSTAGRDFILISK